MACHAFSIYPAEPHHGAKALPAHFRAVIATVSGARMGRGAAGREIVKTGLDGSFQTTLC
jgi:hypothetical protein